MTISDEYSCILKDVDGCNGIKYAAYRTASKLKIIQDRLGFDKIRISTISALLNIHRVFLTNENIFLKNEELNSILYDLLYPTGKKSDLSFEFFRNVFEFEDKISVLDLKVGLICLSNSPLESKYQYLFNQLCDHNLLLSRLKLEKMLKSMLKITKYLSESNTFDFSLIASTVESCFEQNTLGVDRCEFVRWTFREPQILVWLSTLYRLRCSQDVKHRIDCSFCSTQIVGLRYNCLKCLRYDLCQNCFFTGKTSKKHKNNHRVREYCLKTSCIETTLFYLKSCLERLCKNESKLQYLPAVKDELEMTVYERPQEKLETIIAQLSERMKLIKTSADVQAHLDFLNRHLENLKSLKDDIKEDIFMSTPLRTERVIESFSLEPTAETSYTQQLQKDLDIVMQKLNGLLESNFTEEEITNF